MEPWHIYALFFWVGVIVIAIALVFGEFDSDHDGFGLLSPLAIATGLTAGGFTGVVVEQTPFSAFSLLSSVVIGVLSYGLVLAAKRALKKQESNQHFGIQTYLNQKATVVNSVIAVKDWGEITFRDVTGARVQCRAYNSHNTSLHMNDEVVIHSIENGELYVAPYEA